MLTLKPTGQEAAAGIPTAAPAEDAPSAGQGFLERPNCEKGMFL